MRLRDSRQDPAELRQFGELAAAVGAHRVDGQQHFAAGQAHVNGLLAQFEADLAKAESDVERSQVRLKRRQLSSYTEFSIAAAAARLAAGLAD